MEKIKQIYSNIKKLGNQEWITDERWTDYEDDMTTISMDLLTPKSSIWDLKVGQIVDIDDTEGNNIKGFKGKGKVLGFNKDGQQGRVVYIETAPGKMIWSDAFTNGEIIL